MRMVDPVRLQRILDTAACLFAERRYHEVRIDDIAARAGVSKGAVYHYYKDKEDLYIALVQQGKDRLFEEVRERIAEMRNPEDKILAIVEEICRFHNKHPSLLELVQRVEYSQYEKAAALRECSTRFRDLLIGVVRELDASGRWLVGKDLSYVDLSAFQVVEGLRYAFPNAMSRLEPRLPLLMALHDRVATLLGVVRNEIDVIGEID